MFRPTALNPESIAYAKNKKLADEIVDIIVKNFGGGEVSAHAKELLRQVPPPPLEQPAQ